MDDTGQMDWWQMMGQSPQMPPADPSGSPAAFGQMMNPDPTQQIQMYNRPANNAQEYEKRLGGWSELVQRFQSDPNLQRAMMMTGAMMAQPLQPGQTPLGNAANAGVVGMNAYTAGTAADRAAMAEAAKQAREERRLGMEEQKLPYEIAGTQARTKSTEAATPGIQAESDVKQRTVDDLVASAVANRKKVEIAASNEEKDAALRDLTRDNEALKASAQRLTIPRQVQQEIEKNDATIQNLQAGTTEKAAKGRQETAKAGEMELTSQILRGLPLDEQKAFVLKTGRYGSGKDSAMVQQRDLWGDIYDKLPADDPNKKLDKTQFILRRLQEGKQSSALKDLTDYVSKMEGAGLTPDPQLVDQYTQAARLAGASRAATGSQGEAAPAQKVTGTIAQPGAKGKKAPSGKTQGDAVKISGQDEFDALPSGSYFVGPDGKTRRKP